MNDATSSPTTSNMAPPGRDTIVDFIADIFERRGAESYIGECVSTSQHMLQSAQQAEQQRAGDAMIAAALLHDIGHYTSEFGEDAHLDDIDNLHEEAGARLLAAYFPAEVTEPVRLHVSAKRYLCATNPQYLQQLSAASITSLNLQGGPMNPQEVTEFESNPHFRAAVRVRVWDAKAKVVGIETPDFKYYMPLLMRLVAYADNP